MKYLNWKLTLLAVVPCLIWLGNATPAQAADNEPAAATGDRLQRLERRLDELANRQEQILRRVEAQRGDQPGSPRPPAAASPERPAQRPEAAPERRGERPAEALAHFLGLLFLVGVVCNILLAIWIFTDIRRRGEGHGIFVVLALVAGIPTAIIYALVRIGDRTVIPPIPPR
jgi:hypothetical protein